MPKISEFTERVEITEIDSALTNTKTGKAAGPDDILPDLLTHLAPKARIWLTKLFTTDIKTGKFCRF